MAPSGGSRGAKSSRGINSIYGSPPTLRAGATFPLLRIIYQLMGLVLTLIVFVLVFVISPVFLIARIALFCKKKSRRRQGLLLDEPSRSCCHNLPIAGKGPNLGIVIIHDNDISPMYCNSLFKNISSVSGPSGSASALGSNERLMSLSRVWDGERDPWSESELKLIVNDPSSFPTEVTSIYISRSTDYYPHMLMISTPSFRRARCVANMIGIIANNEKLFDIEPIRSLRTIGSQRTTIVRVVSLFIFQLIHFFTEGPSSILSLYMKGKNSLWKHLQEDDRRTVRKRKTIKSTLLNRESSTVLMESVPDDVIVIGSKDSTTSIPPHLRETPPPATHRRGWCIVPQIDLVGRSERLLRASSPEMFLTLVAGTIRTYCREQGIPHPPDLGVILPVSMKRESTSLESQHCNTILFPFMLPTGVEGAIPRLWSIQKRLYEGLGGHLPSTIQTASFLANFCFPQSVATTILKPLFSAHSIYFAFYRTSHVGKSLDQVLLFPSLNENVKAAFVFVQCGYETKLCVSLCKRTFPDVNSMLRIFEKETTNLLDHLSGKILSLPQTTILPGSRFSQSSDEEGEMFGSSYLRQKTAEMQLEDEAPDDKYSLEELHQLLGTVQNELDGMRANPQGDRGEYIRKLNELEQRMQRFHQIITKRLGQENILDQADTEEIVDNILAPYKNEPEHQKRRFSREFSRTDEQSTRKVSRTSM